MANQTKTIAETLKQRVKEVRDARGLSIRELSRRVADLGHTFDSSALVRLEAGERRVTVDDLIALSLALDVSPDALLLPLEDGPLVELPGLGALPAHTVRDWLDGRALPFDKKPSQITDADRERVRRWWSQQPTYIQEAADIDGVGTLLASLHPLLRSLSGRDGNPKAGRGGLLMMRAAIDLLLAQEEGDDQ